VVIQGAGIEHFVYRLDLSGDRAAISARMDALGTWLLQRIHPPSTVDDSAVTRPFQEAFA